MIRVHHLRYSRSTRLLWALEELGIPYELIEYDRNPRTMRAPAELAIAHPLGKAPVLEDGDIVIAESGAAMEYLIATHGGGRLGPAQGTPDWPAYIEWLHFAEGTAMLGLIMRLMDGYEPLPRPARYYADDSIDRALNHIEHALAGGGWLVGQEMTGADIQIGYVVDFADSLGLLEDRPTLRAYRERLLATESLQRAIARGGPMQLPARSAQAQPGS
jgi:glutathione S-transferase